MTQPNLKVQSDASTAIATATTWTASSVVENGQIFTRGTATDLELVVSFGSLAGTAAAGSVTPLLVGSAATSFATTASISPDKGALATVGASSISTHAHYAQLQYPYYRVNYTPTGASTATGTAMSIAVFSGLQDSLDNSDQ